MQDYIKLYARRAFADFGIELHAVAERTGGIIAIAQPLVMQAVDGRDLGATFPPTAMIDDSAAQGLMDELWRLGIRPTRLKDQAGALEATQRHLEDMRRLVFDSAKRSFISLDGNARAMTPGRTTT